jgi:hypothetical protein
MTVAPQALRPWRQVTEAARREAQRLIALCSLEIVDTPADPEFDRIARLAAAFFKTPIALVSLVDADSAVVQSSSRPRDARNPTMPCLLRLGNPIT